MTPTLFGRWQTRIFLLATVGVLVTLPFYWGILGESENDNIYFWVLFYIAIFGLAWDVLYNYLQKFLWDYDWPGILQLGAGIIEGLFLLVVVKLFGLPQIPADELDIMKFIQHYSLVWLAVYLAAWVVMRLLFTRWRFRGGEWLRGWPSSRS